MNRQGDYIARLPRYYEGVLEIEIIADALGDELDRVDLEQRILLDNQFILTSDTNGLAAQERLFSIIAAPSESLDFRRRRLIELRSKMPPYTIKWLQERLDAMLDGEYILQRSVGERTLYIYVLLTKAEYLPLIADYVLTVIPANMVVNVVLKYNTHVDLAGTTHRQLGRHTHRQLPVQPL